LEKDAGKLPAAWQLLVSLIRVIGINPRLVYRLRKFAADIIPASLFLIRIVRVNPQFLKSASRNPELHLSKSYPFVR
jgi:hypothetical protein